MPNSNDDITIDLLTNQLFEVLKISSQSKDEMLALSQNIAQAVNALSTDLSPSNMDLYEAQIYSSNLDHHQIGKISKILKNIFLEDKYKELREIIDLPLGNILNANHVIEREIETNKRKKVNVNQSPKFEQIRETLRDKAVAHQDDFSNTREKEMGESVGYIADQEVTGDTFLLKQFYKNNADCLIIDNRRKQRQALDDRVYAVHELMAAALFEFLLYNRTPKEALVEPNESNPNLLYIRSKFFKDAVLLSEFSRGNSAKAKQSAEQSSESTTDKILGSKHLDDNLYTDSQDLQKLEGFEKVIAACYILGDEDYHPANLMVQREILGNKEKFIVTKIDHGRAFMSNILGFASIVDSMYYLFSQAHYDTAITDGNLSFNIDKYNEALKQMLSQSHDERIDSVVDNKADELKKYGFNPAGLSEVKLGRKRIWININNFDDLKKFYKENIKEAYSNMREIAESVDIVSKFSNITPEFKNGGWLKDFANSPIKDPIAYAAHHNIEIEGKNALKWAYLHDHSIKGYDSDINIKVQQPQWEKIKDAVWENGKLVSSSKWEEKPESVTKTQKIFQSLEPIEYILKEKKEQNIPLSLSESEFLAYLGFKTSSGKDIEINELNIDSVKNAVNKMHDQDKTTANKLIHIIDNFANDKLNQKITKNNIELLYNELLDNLKTEKYLSEQEIVEIKKDQNYQNNIDNTVKLIEMNTPRNSDRDKLHYKLANFLSNKLPNLSKYFDNKNISHFQKIDDLKNTITGNIQIGVTLPSKGTKRKNIPINSLGRS